MLKKSITFTDLNGEEVTEDHYFHLSKADMVELELSEKDGLSKKLQEIVDTGDGNEIIQTFKDLLLRAYGMKAPDGRSFIKNNDLREQFEQSEAYSALFMDLVTNADKAAEFVNGIVPAGLEQDIQKMTASREAEVNNAREAFEGKPAETPPPGTPRVLSKAEATEMDGSELSHLLMTGQAVISDEG